MPAAAGKEGMEDGEAHAGRGGTQAGLRWNGGSYQPVHVAILYAHAAQMIPALAHKLAGRTRGTTSRSTRDAKTAPCNAAQNVPVHPSASRKPAGWVLAASMKCPFAACANDVVIPHVGQGRPKNTAHPHAGRPRCVCVPCPFVDGSRKNAVRSTARQNVATAAQAIRPEVGRRLVGAAARAGCCVASVAEGIVAVACTILCAAAQARHAPQHTGWKPMLRKHQSNLNTPLR